MRPPHNIMYELIRDLALHLERKPTVEEAHTFIFGDIEERRQVWDLGPAEQSSTYQADQTELDQTLDELITYLSSGESDARIPAGD